MIRVFGTFTFILWASKYFRYIYLSSNILGLFFQLPHSELWVFICLLEKMESHTGCSCLDFLHCVFSNVFSSRLPGKMHLVTLAALTWLFSTVCFRMYPHRACKKECKVTLIAFVWLFSTVSFQKRPQIACKVTPIAFIWVFSGVHSQMYPQRSSSSYACSFRQTN